MAGTVEKIKPGTKYTTEQLVRIGNEIHHSETSIIITAQKVIIDNNAVEIDGGYASIVGNNYTIETLLLAIMEDNEEFAKSCVNATKKYMLHKMFGK